MGVNKPRNPRNPRNIPNSRRPQEWRAKPDVPSAVIVIYIVMAILILAICAIVFVVTLKNTGDTNASNSSGISQPASANSSSEGSSASSPQSSVSQSTVSQSTVSQSSTESSDEWTSRTSSNWTVISTDPNSEPTRSGGDGVVIYSLEYSKDFFKNSLFIGDSIFTGLSGYGFLDAENVAAKIGYTPSAAMNKAFDAKGITAVEYAKQRQPDRIYLMLGSNTMASGTNFDVIVSQYRALVEKLQEDCPNSKICVISIPPVTEDSSAAKAGNITNENIRMVNTKFNTMAEDCQADYFDLNCRLRDETGFFREELAEQDGLHFMGKTYKVMLSALQKKYGDSVIQNTVIQN